METLGVKPVQWPVLCRHMPALSWDVPYDNLVSAESDSGRDSHPVLRVELLIVYGGELYSLPQPRRGCGASLQEGNPRLCIPCSSRGQRDCCIQEIAEVLPQDSKICKTTLNPGHNRMWWQKITTVLFLCTLWLCSLRFSVAGPLQSPMKWWVATGVKCGLLGPKWCL